MKANMAVILECVHRCLRGPANMYIPRKKEKGIMPCEYTSEKAALDALPFVDTVARNGT